MKSDRSLEATIEVLLLVVSEPMTVVRLVSCFDDPPPSEAAVKAAIESLQAATAGRGLELIEVASGYRYQVREAYAPEVARLFEAKPQRYSRALMETLALIVYRQPTSRGEIEQIRGVSTASQTMRTLLDREWVKIVGYKDTPGKPALYGTTQIFLDDFGMKALDELPELPNVEQN